MPWLLYIGEGDFLGLVEFFFFFFFTSLLCWMVRVSTPREKESSNGEKPEPRQRFFEAGRRKAREGRSKGEQQSYVIYSRERDKQHNFSKDDRETIRQDPLRTDARQAEEEKKKRVCRGINVSKKESFPKQNIQQTNENSFFPGTQPTFLREGLSSLSLRVSVCVLQGPPDSIIARAANGSKPPGGAPLVRCIYCNGAYMS